jgi:DNA polymerase V
MSFIVSTEKADLRFALVDCNNFYVSCERLFNPKLIGKPVVVLSNNDGCVVARSQEVKDLGIKMGVPVFKIQAEIEKYNIQVYSSNYALYGDLSGRVMSTLSYFAPDVEIYSIDEAFLDLSGFSQRNLTEYCEEIRRTVLMWVGIPVSIGIGSTKTLAKLANRVAKKSKSGVFDLSSCDNPEQVLAKTDVGDIWGIGSRYGNWCRSQGIITALDFRNTNTEVIRKKMGVMGLRMLMELQGQSCLPLELVANPKKETCVSRSFPHPVTTVEELKEAIAHFVHRAAEKLRRQKQSAQVITVFARTSPFQEDFYADSATNEFAIPTNDTVEILRVASRLTELIYREDHEFKKAGIIMTGLLPEGQVQGNLFDDGHNADNRQRSAELMKVIDKLNTKFGRHTLKFAAAGVKQAWLTESEKRRNAFPIGKSPRYTTSWNELLTVS